jgi:hypothetical protein
MRRNDKFLDDDFPNFNQEDINKLKRSIIGNEEYANKEKPRTREIRY